MNIPPAAESIKAKALKGSHVFGSHGEVLQTRYIPDVIEESRLLYSWLKIFRGSNDIINFEMLLKPMDIRTLDATKGEARVYVQVAFKFLT
jgi:hypothetical protein